VNEGLRRARLEIGEVERVERLGSLVEIAVTLPWLAGTAQPGQFAQLRCGDGFMPLLRRPFSVAWTQDDTCGFVFEEVGLGTHRLGALRPGDPLDVLGPLGKGFTVEAGEGPALCVSGGVGCAPFPLLIQHLRAAGVRDVTVLSGAATAARLYPAERFARGLADVAVSEATDDGTRGTRGYVTNLVRPVLDERRPRLVYACGPNVMLAALWDLLDDGSASGDIAEASLEAPMGCGFGTCLGCALPARGDDSEPTWALCCTDGPVMRMGGVDWDGIRALPGADVA
jgi:dihydroorotate dehydrogenase electron transfer subunit